MIPRYGCVWTVIFHRHSVVKGIHFNVGKHLTHITRCLYHKASLVWHKEADYFHLSFELGFFIFGLQP